MDFSSYTSVTSESLPPVGSRNEMKYYWSRHISKKRPGILFVSRIFNQGVVPNDFGIPPDQRTIDKALADIRDKQQAYRVAHPEDTALILSYVADYKKGTQYNGREQLICANSPAIPGRLA